MSLAAFDQATLDQAIENVMNDPDMDVCTKAAMKMRLTWLATARPAQVEPAGDWSNWMILAGRGFGKAVALDTPLPTPAGWTAMGDIAVGDQVFDEAGRPCSVTATFDVVPEKAYRVDFSDGTSIDACSEHQWVTWTHRDRKQLQRYEKRTHFPSDWPVWKSKLRDCHGNVTGEFGPRIRTTQEIADTLVFGARGDTNHCIPVCGSLQLSDAELPLDPYLLGCWLGDGHSGGAAITVADPFIVEAFRSDGWRLKPYPTQNAGAATTYGITREGHLFSKTLSFKTVLRRLGVHGDKHVPAAYLRASARQRLALLQGLMDTDGYAGRSNVEFCSTSAKLTASVMELATSLGQKPRLLVDRATLAGRDCGVRYRVHWAPTVPVFRLVRKLDSLKPRSGQALRAQHRMIVACTEIDPVPMRCITVDSPNSMFLAGRGMVPTHNTRTSVETFGFWALTRPDTRGALIAPTYADVKDTYYEGESGMLARVPDEAVAEYHKTYAQLHLANGTIIKGFAMESPERLRGPQFHYGASDELCAGGEKAREAWDMYQFGLRLGDKPQTIITTTPKPMALLREIIADAETVVTKGSTYDNAANLAKNFLKNVLRYEGTDLGRQELHAEILDDQSASPLKPEWWKYWTEPTVPRPELILISLDTAYKDKKESDATACTVWSIVRVRNKRKGVTRYEYVAILLKAWKNKLQYPALKAAVQQEQKFWEGKAPKGTQILTLVEDKGSGQSLIQDFTDAGLNVLRYNPGHDSKVFRAHLVSDILKDGRIWVRAMDVPVSPQAPDGIKIFDDAKAVIDECTRFGEPGNKVDDYVDATAQAWSYLRDAGYLSKDSDTRYYHAVSADEDDEEDRLSSDNAEPVYA